MTPAAASSVRQQRTVLPGTRLGRYEIITHLADGGMASVYLGRALGAAGFHRLVAIKLLHPHVAADEQFITMFLDEARLAARIHHPNVVPTLDLQHGPEGHYLVMEFIEGESLLGLLRQSVKVHKPLPAAIAIRVALDALAGLHAAHELTGDLGEPLQIVHRDVSPHNILVGVDGVGRIVDFGIARAEERMGTTRDGQVKGKLAYMAPEQTTSEPVDRRVDVFTMGIVLWECLSGRRLFRGQSDAEVLRNLLDKPIPRLREVSPEYSKGVEDVIARALNRTISERWATAADFADALEQAATPLGTATSRQVGAYVREAAGEAIDNLMRRARAFQEGSKVSNLSTTPLALSDNPDSSVRASTPMGVATTAPHAVARNDFAASQLTGSDVYAFRSRRPLVLGIVAAVVGGAIIATTTWFVTSQHGPTASSPSSVAAPLPQLAAATTVAAPTESSVSVMELPHPNGDTRGHPSLPRKALPGVSASAVVSAVPVIGPGTQATTPTVTATQAVVTKPPVPVATSSSFNPESM